MNTSMQGRQAVVLGGGRVAQGIHIPMLQQLGAAVTVVEPLTELYPHLAARGVHDVVASIEDVPRADFAVVATPWPTHSDLVVHSLERGWDVLCEKPASLVPTDVDRMIEASERTGNIVQVGYMKQWDTAYRTAVDLLQDQHLVAVVAEVFDANDPSFLVQRKVLRPADLPAAPPPNLGDLEWVLGRDTREAWAMRAFGRSMGGSLLHEINLVRTVTPLDAPLGVEVSSEGTGVTTSWQTATGIPIRLSYRALEGSGVYVERINFVCREGVFELSFQQPYSAAPGGSLTWHTNGKSRLVEQETGSPFENQLRGFADAMSARSVVSGCTLEDARADLAAMADAWNRRTERIAPIADLDLAAGRSFQNLP